MKYVEQPELLQAADPLNDDANVSLHIYVLLIVS